MTCCCNSCLFQAYDCIEFNTKMSPVSEKKKLFFSFLSFEPCTFFRQLECEITEEILPNVCVFFLLKW